MNKPIENYGIIGDLDTTALVGIDGSIDFMCFPHFDSPSLFASLLDEKSGYFQIAPVSSESNNKQMYLPESNILLTRFLSDTGVGEISDFMVIEDSRHAHSLIRRVKCIRHSMQFKLQFRPRFDYARCKHEVKKEANGFLFIPENKKHPSIKLKTNKDLEILEGDCEGVFELQEGETAYFLLELASDEHTSHGFDEEDLVNSFKSTLNYWQNWVEKSTYHGRWQEMVKRSALTLKLLTSRKHGSIVAAPTFGLPEVIGGERNWDYRFTWIRDASFTLYALMRLGFTEESGQFMNWLEQRCKELEGGNTIQPIYGVDGRHVLTEEILDHMSGYQNSTPVRIGNAAYKQLQLDIYGELMDAVYMYDKFSPGISFDLWESLKKLLEWMGDNWHKPDEGIWEVRSGPHHYLYSRFMCWVAVDRAIRLARRRSLSGPIDKWIKLREEIHNDIIKNFWNEKLQSFVQLKGSDTLDASLLTMPLLRYISPTDPKWMSTLKAIDQNIVVDSLVFRYVNSDDHHDGLTGIEGTFNMCSFWYVEALARSGDVKKARFLFEKMLSYANHLGLYSEELSSRGLHIGNFPQAFTHIALISAAFELNRRLNDQNL